MARDNTAAADRRVRGPTDISGSGWKDILKHTWSDAGEQNLGLIASGIAFNAFLAFVPLLTAIVLSYGLIAAPEQVARHIATLAETMPQQVASLIGSQLRNIVETTDSRAGFGLLLALGIALYGAMRGASGIISGLNIVFGVDERRSFLRQIGIALLITFGLILVFLIASVGISVVGFLEDLLPALGGAVSILLQAGFWLLAAAFVSLVIGLTYRHAPNRPEPDWRWITPGSALATVVWVMATWAFAFYVRNFGGYNATYGALGAVIIFLTWLNLSAYILLLGAKLNAILQKQGAAEGGSHVAFVDS